MSGANLSEQDIKRISYGIHLGYGASTAPHHAQAHTLTGADHTLSGATAGQALEATAATTFGLVSRELRAYRTADGTANTGTTLADDAILTVTLAASSNYTYLITGFFSNAGATEGLKVALSGTVGVTAMKAQISIWDDTLNSLVGFARVTALASSVGAGLSSGSNYFEIAGTIESSTAGTLLLQHAQNAAGAGAGVTVQRGSCMVVTKIG